MVKPFSLGVNAVIPIRPWRRTGAEQTVIHRSSGIPTENGCADPFLVFLEGIYAIGEAVVQEYPSCGAVITGQVVSIVKQHPIDAPVFVRGRVSAFGPTERGNVFTTIIEARNQVEELFAEMATTILLVDPTRPSPTRLPQKASSASLAASETIGRFTFTPEATRHFEFEGPSPHTDLEAARAAGFPKPIVGGNQVFSMIWKRFVEPNFTLPVRLNFKLKRPIFWDEEVTFERMLPDNAVARDAIEVRGASGKTAIVCEILGLRQSVQATTVGAPHNGAG